MYEIYIYIILYIIDFILPQYRHFIVTPKYHRIWWKMIPIYTLVYHLKCLGLWLFGQLCIVVLL